MKLLDATFIGRDLAGEIIVFNLISLDLFLESLVLVLQLVVVALGFSESTAGFGELVLTNDINKLNKPYFELMVTWVTARSASSFALSSLNPSSCLRTV